ncbi:MAG TPA: NAD-glutamate dehydrogenase, partial [Azospirillaceae bacterium]|nr:NAD-glutamate dehydrogenase [Azospirillaceae bacterium]
MALKAELLKDELTEKIIRQVRGRLSRDKVENTERFIRRFYANVPPDDILQASPDQLYGAALAIWQFAAQRRRGEAKVRVYNPRVEDNGWQSPHTVAEIVNDDMPFLVDSVTSALNQFGLSVHLVIHPIVRVRRDDEGRLVELTDAPANGDGSLAESFMHVEFDTQTGADRLREIHNALARVLGDVRAAVEDWRAMRAKVLEVVHDVEDGAARTMPEVDRIEAVDFLQWVDDDHFTFLGYREYRFGPPAEGASEPTLAVVADSGLGVLRDPEVLVFDGLRNFAALPPEVRYFLRSPNLLMVTKANRRSTVHRPVHLDAIFVKIFNEDNEVVGERLFVGLFTSTAYTQSPRDIPYLRRKVARVIDRAGFAPKSHDAKALMHILEHFPRDELVQITDDELLETALGILHLQERQRVALFARRDPFGRFASCFVFVPRDRYDTALRLRIQGILEKSFQGTCSTFYTQLDEDVHARIHYIIKTDPNHLAEVDLDTVEAQLVETARTWPDRLHAALVDAHGEERGLALLARYANAFPLGYQERFSADVAVVDIDRVEAVVATGTLGMNLYRPLEAADDELRFKIYHADTPVPLSDVLPMLERMDLRVITEMPYQVSVGGLDRTV